MELIFVQWAGEKGKYEKIFMGAGQCSETLPCLMFLPFRKAVMVKQVVTVYREPPIAVFHVP